MEVCSLFRVDRLELNRLIGVLSPARRAAAVEVLLDVVPAELADLKEIASQRGWKELPGRKVTW